MAMCHHHVSAAEEEGRHEFLTTVTANSCPAVLSDDMESMACLSSAMVRRFCPKVFCRHNVPCSRTSLSTCKHKGVSMRSSSGAYALPDLCTHLWPLSFCVGQQELSQSLVEH